mgnify:CR=1 FL=1
MRIGIRSALAASFMIIMNGGSAAGQGYETVAVLSGIAKVRDGDGVLFGDVDIGRHQVATGHPRDCPKFSGGRYADAEEDARRAGHVSGAIYALPTYCSAR